LKKIALLIGVIFLVVCKPEKILAQDQKNDVAINAGVGGSAIYLLIGFYDVSATTTGINISYSPAYSLTADYGLTNQFSIGPAMGYQIVTITYNNYDNLLIRKSIVQNISRLNIGIRLLYHFFTNSRIDIYTGGRPGFSHWSNTNNSGDPSFVGSTSPFNLPSIQWLLGIRAYLIDNLGLHLEGALGTPYFIEGGITLRFRSTKSVK